MVRYFQADNRGVGQAIEWIRDCLEKSKMKEKDQNHWALAAEETLEDLISYASEEGQIRVAYYTLVALPAFTKSHD